MKKDEFRRLVEDVSKCHICERLVTLPHIENSECLENDDHGLDTDRPYINRWNLWQGNLDADIMVIGQDYGQKEDGVAVEVCSWSNKKDQTNIRLKELFEKAFKIALDSNETPLFFTNMANCYRKKRTSGGMHSGWLPICANKYMERLIRIVRPKIIIVLGRSAFEALHCMENLSVTRKVLPSSCSIKLGTFSRKTIFGRLQSTMRVISKNKLPLLSSNPRCLPAIEKGWQGKPPANTSKSSILSALTLRISCSTRYSLPKLYL